MTSDTQSRLFQPLTIESAPGGSKPVLERVKKDFGFIPNLMATFANSPAVLKGYLALDAARACRRRGRYSATSPRAT
jgi:hypothetical protein